MKSELLEELAAFEKDLRGLKKAISEEPGPRIAKQALRRTAEKLANRWVEDFRSPLEHKFKLPVEVIHEMSELMKHLYVLSRPNNQKSSYVKTLNSALAKFKDRFMVPVQQTGAELESVFDLTKLVPEITNAEETEYFQEAINCAQATYRRAAIVMGWCAVIDRIHKKLHELGADKFNAAAAAVKSQGGRFKYYKKDVSIGGPSELWEVADRYLITICEQLGLVNSKEADRLIEIDLQWRNHSAHPGEAPLEDAHMTAFFTDIVRIVLTSPSFELTR